MSPRASRVGEDILASKEAPLQANRPGWGAIHRKYKKVDYSLIIEIIASDGETVERISPMLKVIAALLQDVAV